MFIEFCFVDSAVSQNTKKNTGFTQFHAETEQNPDILNRFYVKSKSSLAQVHAKSMRTLQWTWSGFPVCNETFKQTGFLYGGEFVVHVFFRTRVKTFLIP